MEKKQVLTTFEAAALCNVSYNTIKNWIKRDLLSAYRTAGGHLRIHSNDLESFLREYGIPMTGEKDGDRRRVLILDKDGSFGKEFCDMFKSDSDKMDIVTTENAFEAGMMLESIKPDLVFLHSSAVGMDSAKSCSLIRKSPALKHVKVAVITSTKSGGPQTKPTGADIMLENPVDRVKLHDFVEQSMAAKGGVRARKRKNA